MKQLLARVWPCGRNPGVKPDVPGGGADKLKYPSSSQTDVTLCLPELPPPAGCRGRRGSKSKVHRPETRAAHSSELIPPPPPSSGFPRTFNLRVQELADGSIPAPHGGRRDAPRSIAPRPAPQKSARRWLLLREKNETKRCLGENYIHLTEKGHEAGQFKRMEAPEPA